MAGDVEQNIATEEKTTVLSSEEALRLAASSTGKFSGTGRISSAKRSSGRHSAPAEKKASSSFSTNMKKASAWLRGKSVSLKAASKVRPKIRKTPFFLAVTGGLVLLVLISAVLIRTTTDAREYKNYYTLAQNCYAEKDYGTALSYLRKAARINDGAEVRNMMVECYYAEGNYSRALEILRSMDTRDSSVAARIQRIEAERLARESPESVQIAGKSYPLNTNALVLDGMGLRDEDTASVARIYSLVNLSLANNGLTDISPLSALGGLTSLNLSGNRISDLSPLRSLSSLRVLYLDGNPVTDFTPLEDLPELSMLSIKNIALSAEQRQALSLALPNCAIHSEASSAAPQITLGGATFETDSTELRLSELGLTDITALSDCRSLTFLDLSGNSITDISPLMSIPNLETLILSGNQVSNIYPLMGLTSLRYLYLDGNRITDITALSGLSELRELYLADNPLTTLSGIENLNYLECLDISGTGAVNEMLDPLYSCYSLRLIRLNSNPALTGNAVDELNQHLLNCSIERDELSYVLEISGYSFYDTDTSIDLSGKGLTDLTWIRDFKDPEQVDLSENAISNLYVLQWMENAGKIRELDLSSNKISDLNGIVYLTGIEKLDLSHNDISAINPLKMLVTLKELRIIDTKLTSEQIVDLCNTLPNCSVIYTEG